MNVNIGELLEELKKTENTTASIAKRIDGLSEKKLRQALKHAGYEFSNISPKGWYYKGKEVEPLHKDIFDYVQKSVPYVNESEMMFTLDEIHVLKNLVQKEMERFQVQEDTLQSRIAKLGKGQKVRKTIVIYEKIGELLDQFAEQTRYGKSELLEIAILDLISKYK